MTNPREAHLVGLFRKGTPDHPVDIHQQNAGLRELLKEHSPGLMAGPVPEDPVEVAYQNEQMQDLLSDALEETMLICDSCHQPIPDNKAMVIWNEDRTETVTELRIIHRKVCDDRRLRCSCLPKDLPRIAQKRFLSPADEARVGKALEWLEG